MGSSVQQCLNGEAIRQWASKKHAGEGEQDSDVEPETQTESPFRENHFVWVREGWRDWEEEVWRSGQFSWAHPFHSVFLQRSPGTSPLLPFKRLSFHPPSYMWPKALSYTNTERCFEKSVRLPQRPVSLLWPWGETHINCWNVFNISYSHTNLILATQNSKQALNKKKK